MARVTNDDACQELKVSYSDLLARPNRRREPEAACGLVLAEFVGSGLNPRWRRARARIMRRRSLPNVGAVGEGSSGDASGERAIETSTNKIVEVLGLGIDAILAELSAGLDGAAARPPHEELLDMTRLALHELALEIGQAATDAQRLALRAQTGWFNAKLETTRTAAEVKLQNQKAALEHSFLKSLQEKVAELDQEGGMSKMLEEALSRESEAKHAAERLEARATRAEDTAKSLEALLQSTNEAHAAELGRAKKSLDEANASARIARIIMGAECRSLEQASAASETALQHARASLTAAEEAAASASAAAEAASRKAEAAEAAESARAASQADDAAQASLALARASRLDTELRSLLQAIADADDALEASAAAGASGRDEAAREARAREEAEQEARAQSERAERAETHASDLEGQLRAMTASRDEARRTAETAAAEAALATSRMEASRAAAAAEKEAMRVAFTEEKRAALSAAAQRAAAAAERAEKRHAAERASLLEQLARLKEQVAAAEKGAAAAAARRDSPIDLRFDDEPMDGGKRTQLDRIAQVLGDARKAVSHLGLGATGRGGGATAPSGEGVGVVELGSEALAEAVVGGRDHMPLMVEGHDALRLAASVGAELRECAKQLGAAWARQQQLWKAQREAAARAEGLQRSLEHAEATARLTTEELRATQLAASQQRTSLVQSALSSLHQLRVHHVTTSRNTAAAEKAPPPPYLGSLREYSRDGTRAADGALLPATPLTSRPGTTSYQPLTAGASGPQTAPPSARPGTEGRARRRGEARAAGARTARPSPRGLAVPAELDVGSQSDDDDAAGAAADAATDANAMSAVDACGDDAGSGGGGASRPSHASPRLAAHQQRSAGSNAADCRLPSCTEGSRRTHTVVLATPSPPSDKPHALSSPRSGGTSHAAVQLVRRARTPLKPPVSSPLLCPPLGLSNAALRPLTTGGTVSLGGLPPGA